MCFDKSNLGLQQNTKYEHVCLTFVECPAYVPSLPRKPHVAKIAGLRAFAEIARVCRDSRDCAVPSLPRSPHVAKIAGLREFAEIA